MSSSAEDITSKLWSLMKQKKYTLSGLFGLSSLIFGRKVYYYFISKTYKYPPIFSGLPFYGVFFDFIISPKKVLYNAGKAGPISMIKMGQNYIVYLNDPELAKQVLMDKRLYNRIPVKKGTEGSSAFSILNGTEWKNRRKHVMKSLMVLCKSEFIVDKTRETIKIAIEKDLDNIIQNNELWYPSKYTNYFGFNNIFSAMFNKNLKSFDDPFIRRFMEYNAGFLKYISLSFLLRTLFPDPFNIPEYILKTHDKTYGFRRLINDEMQNWMNNNGYIVDINKNIYKCNNSNENVYAEMIATEYNNGNITALQIVTDLVMILQAGVDTTSKSAEFGFILLALNPETQERVYNELKNAHPNGIFKSSNILKLHIFRAFIYEMLKVGSITPMGIPHFISQDIDIQHNNKEYTIPKGSMLFLNNYYVHNHLDIPGWKNNNKDLNHKSIKLNLNNFLDKNGKFKMNDNFMLFGRGRDCVGQSLAIKGLYAVFGEMILKYKFIWDNNTPKILKVKHSVDGLISKIGLKVEKR